MIKKILRFFRVELSTVERQQVLAIWAALL